MRLSDLPLSPSPPMLRQFAGLWIVFFGGLAFWHGWAHQEPRLAAGLALLALTVGLAGILWPTVVRPVFIAWLVLVFPIGWTISRLALLLLFGVIVTPVALFFRLTGRDALSLRRAAHRASYWTPKPQPSSVGGYLRQF